MRNSLMVNQSRRPTNRSLVRKGPKVEDYDRALIVCEDSKSSPKYFEDLIRSERLSSANVRVTGDCGSDPMSVVNKAIEIYEESLNETNLAAKYDQVFCLVDRDKHPNFSSALNKVNQYRNNGYPIHWVASDPCFEYWYLCHFTQYTKEIVSTGNNSSGDNCVKLLNIEWKKTFNENYDKGKSKSYELLKNIDIKIPLANSQNTLKIAISNGVTNPSTQVHELIKYLIHLKTETPKIIIYPNNSIYFIAQ